VYKGNIVQFFEGQKLITGVCLEDSGNRVHVLTSASRELNVTINRLLHTSSYHIDVTSSKEALLYHMKEFDQKQQELMRQVDVKALWEQMVGEGEVFDAGFLARAVFGENSGSDHRAAILLALIEDRLHFKLHGSQFKINTPEQIHMIVTKRERESQQQHIIEDGSIWLESVMQGESYSGEKNELYIRLLKEFVLFGCEAPDYQLSREILDQVKVFDQKACFNILVTLGVFDADENLWLPRYNIRTEWPQSVLLEAEALIQSNKNETSLAGGRRDLTHLHVFSIDDALTRDVDDAISFEKQADCYCLGIHITDVASCIKPGCALDHEAKQRATSVYLPEEKIPMLPVSLSEHLLSLNEGERRPALSFLVKLTPAGDVIGSEVVLSSITVTRRMTYEEVDAAIERNPLFADLYQVAAALMEKRKQRGALLLSIPELQVVVDGQKHIHLNIRERTAPSQVIVSESMILANYIAGQLLQDRDIPALYRKQAQPRESILLSEQPALFQLIRQRKVLNRVDVGIEPGAHSSLGLDVYTTITSPLRKYYDLIMQQQIVSLLSGKPLVYGTNDLQSIAHDIEVRLTKTATVEQERQRYWLLKHMEGKIGERFSALVIDKRARSYSILIHEYLLETNLPVAAGTVFSPGQIISVTLEKVDPFNGFVKFSCRNN
jgi:exoribonuclease-2